MITGADCAIGIELVRELCKRGAERVIMGVTNTELGQVLKKFDDIVAECGRLTVDGLPKEFSKPCLVQLFICR